MSAFFINRPIISRAFASFSIFSRSNISLFFCVCFFVNLYFLGGMTFFVKFLLVF